MVDGWSGYEIWRAGFSFNWEFKKKKLWTFLVNEYEIEMRCGQVY